ncbi:Rieske 2Fe-2S domain-containing protein [Brevundimonas sp. BH3]|uniref:Rieske 2Fe-2S domain-containing protein n=1 Tax=Brevundimonas sp. BH3 TaxID=3133089 RepID=UPI00325016E1
MAGTQDYGLGPFTYPRGWFLAAESKEVTNKPLAVRYFGQELVLYRGESGRVFMVDAYCPHMGTHLAKNESSYVVQDKMHVEGDNIRCPYHAWRFGPDGKCNEIPYSKAPIPAAAKIRTWKVEEKYGCVFVWHDPEGGEPDYDLPVIPQWDNPAFVRWDLDHLGELPCHPKEIIDNICDVAHLGPTHGGPCEYFHNEFDGVVARQRQGGYHRALEVGVMLETDTWYTGPGILISNFNEGNSVMFICHTPVDDGRTRAWHALLVHSGKEVSEPSDKAMQIEYQAGSLAAFAQDFDIWMNKAPCITPLAVPGDGAYGKVKTWYQQFYNPRAEAEVFQKRANGIYKIPGMPTVREDAA